MQRDGPMTDSWGDICVSKVRCDILEMLNDVNLSNVEVYRDANKYPEGCEITLMVMHDPSRKIKITVFGDEFKKLQSLILATMGMDDCDEIT